MSERCKSFPSFPSSSLGTASWESKLELLHSCVPELELGNKVEHEAGEPGIKEGGGAGAARDTRHGR